jgi:hypothetical protein
LERGDRAGDLAACGLITVSIASFSTGLAFLVGVAVAVLIHPDRRQRAWVFLLPSLLYAAWWFAVRSSSDPGDQVVVSNLLLAPSYAFDALAATLTGLSGLNPDVVSGEGLSAVVSTEWGAVLAVAAIAALALRFTAGDVPRSLWVSIAIAATIWTMGALVFIPIRPPNSSRYVFAGAVVTLLVATDALRGMRFSRFAVVALFAACGISMATNLALLRDAGIKFRSYSAQVRAKLAAAELARDHVDPQLNPLQGVRELYVLNEPVASYLEVVDSFGSPAFSLDELKRQTEPARASADETLVRAYDLHTQDARANPSVGQCERLAAPAPGEAVDVALPSGGAHLRTQGAGRAHLLVGRFAPDPSVEVGTLAPARRTALRIPVDESPDPWRARVVGARSVEVCPATRLASAAGA